MDTAIKTYSRRVIRVGGSYCLPIPPAVRRRLGILGGESLLIIEDEGIIRIMKQTKPGGSLALKQRKEI
jgi:bifunctional DNA-binding transcriptional regulator/antitoxin component of YhaV-PrlF toxin-antitoxin module